MLVDVTEQKRAQQELAETHRDLEQKVAALTRLHELSMSLLSSSDLDANLRAILETTIDLCGADFGLLAIYDPESACLRARASVGFRAEILEEIGRLISGSNAGPCGMAFTTRERVEVASVMSDPRFLDYRNVAQEVGFQSVHVTPVLTRSGEILGVLSVHFRTHHVSTQSERQLADICARYAADTIETIRNRSALQESETRFRSFADAAPAILWTTAPNGACNFVSGGWCEFTGQDPQAVLGWGWLEAIHPEDRQKTRDFFVAANERQEPFAMDYRLRRCDGVYRWIASVGRPRFGVGRTYEGYVGSLIDVTDRKQAEEALKDAKNVAEAASRSKDRFLAVLSHELRTPLAPVLMAAAAIEEDSEVSPRLKEDVAMIKRNVELEAKLIDDLLDLSRVTSGKLKLQPVALDVNAAISHVCEICQAQVVEKNIRVICDLAENLPRVSADPSRIQQVLWNILKNAVKFTPEGGVIHIRSATLDGKVSVQIRDSGIGIQPQLLPKIFDMFEQGDARITQQFGGLGLGLAISHAIVELHHGSLRAESEGPHKGATFTLELPQETFPTICLTEVSEVRDMQPERKLRLLVVEDHLDTAKVIQRMLQLWGYAVKIAHSVEEAKELAEQETFDILLSDVGLPDASGYDLMRFIKQRHGIKGLAMSGYGMDEDIRKALDAGFSDHLVKPVNLNQLKQAITRVVESP
jgi:PAS domain S-box-containing protein